MKFKIGDKVKIKPSEQTFYTGMYNLTTVIGIILRQRKGCTYVNFNNSVPGLAILDKDLELMKNQQLLFDFYME